MLSIAVRTLSSADQLIDEDADDSVLPSIRPASTPSLSLPLFPHSPVLVQSRHSLCLSPHPFPLVPLSALSQFTATAVPSNPTATPSDAPAPKLPKLPIPPPATRTTTSGRRRTGRGGRRRRRTRWRWRGLRRGSSTLSRRTCGWKRRRCCPFARRRVLGCRENEGETAITP